jgi:putative intracellular protease/amidase
MKIAILIYNGITMLDAIGPYEVLAQLPKVEIFFVAKKKGEIKSDTGFVYLNAKYNFDDVVEADILLIPGSTIAFVKVMKDKKTLDWIRKVDKTTQFTTSVCSGSLILAATGLLKGLKATSHWKPIDLLKEYGAIPVRERFIQEGKIITAAGVSAGIDMALYLVNKVAGEQRARSIQLLIEYDPSPIYNSGNYTTCEPTIIEKAERQLSRNAKKELSLFESISNIKTFKKIK